MCNLAEDLPNFFKSANEGSCVVIWDQKGYLAEGYRHPSDHSTYTDVKNFNKTLHCKM